MINYRVDLEGPPHYNIATPHLHKANWNTPPAAAPVLNRWHDAFLYSRIKAAFISTYIKFVRQ